MKFNVISALLFWVLVAPSCQSYDFVFVPDSDRKAAHLRFDVQTPSKADILFVVDNSGTMAVEQKLFEESFESLLDALAQLDTSYRIGVTSTDWIGRSSDCNGVEWPNKVPPLGPDLVPLNYANIQAGGRGDCATGAEPTIIGRPHDGTGGRLIASFTPSIFDKNSTLYSELSVEHRDLLETLLPTGVDTGPTQSNGAVGVPFVIDRDVAQADACTACGCDADSCNRGNACFDDCATPVAGALVRAYFSSNLRGLGTSGNGYEEGILSSAWAIGIDPTQSDDDNALNPSTGSTAMVYNQYTGLVDGEQVAGDWIRDEALLAIMYISDEQDCSMSQALRGQFKTIEQGEVQPGAGLAQRGTVCYQHQQFPAIWDHHPIMIDTTRMGELLATKKRNVNRVAMGVIGGLRTTGTGAAKNQFAEAAECFVESDGRPGFDCSCKAPELDINGDPLPFTAGDAQWCFFTQNSNTCDPSSGSDSSCCEALTGSRYIDLANQFGRRAFETVCRDRTDACDESTPEGLEFCGYGPALVDFAEIALRACFALEAEVAPARNLESNIRVERAALNDEGELGELSELPLRAAGDTEAGWYYEGADPENPRVCLTGIDRLIGDRYDIFVLYEDKLQ